MTGTYETPDGEVVEADTAPTTGPPPPAVPGEPAEVVDAEVVDAEVVDAPDAEVADDADPVAVAESQRDEYLDSLRRLQAEFDNYRKRVQKQQTEAAERGALSLVDQLLPVLDTLDQAATHLGDPESGDARALLAASSQLNDVLAKAGLERLDPTGEPFDPTAHEAVGHLPAEEAGAGADGADGPVVGQVMRAGYRWKGNVVRPAMVMVRG
jgi:molecular chaperone GrpE